MNQSKETKNPEFAFRFKSARLHAELTQQELASKVGISQAAIHKLESGQFNSSRKTVAIAMACQVNPVWLATGVGEMLTRTEHQTDWESMDGGTLTGGMVVQLSTLEREMERMIHGMYAIRNLVRRLRNRQRARSRRNEPDLIEKESSIL
ncbi:MAG: helix-turn-helix domain-containing protein [Magnetococcus sp. YQC-9]